VSKGDKRPCIVLLSKCAAAFITVQLIPFLWLLTNLKNFDFVICVPILLVPRNAGKNAWKCRFQYTALLVFTYKYFFSKIIC